MVVLKKLKSATLIETLVATVLIVLVFMISSVLMNTVYHSLQKSNTRTLDAQMHRLLYLAQHQVIQLPYRTIHHDWEIILQQSDQRGVIIVEATQGTTTISKERYVHINQ